MHRQKDASGGSLFHKPTMPPFVGSRRVEEGLEDALDDEDVRDPRGRLVSALVGEDGEDVGYLKGDLHTTHSDAQSQDNYTHTHTHTRDTTLTHELSRNPRTTAPKTS